MVLVYMVTWIPSIYPSHVSINIPAPWIRHGKRKKPAAHWSRRSSFSLSPYSCTGTCIKNCRRLTNHKCLDEWNHDFMIFHDQIKVAWLWSCVFLRRKTCWSWFNWVDWLYDRFGCNLVDAQMLCGKLIFPYLPSLVHTSFNPNSRAWKTPRFFTSVTQKSEQSEPSISRHGWFSDLTIHFAFRSKDPSDPRSRWFMDPMDLSHHEAWHLVRLTPSFAAISQRLQFKRTGWLLVKSFNELNEPWL